MACKLKNGKHPGCVWKDDLSPLIGRILEADALIIGVPIYYSEPTAQFRGLMERLIFCTTPYEQGSYFNGKVNVGFIYTMNASAAYYQQNLRPYIENIENLFSFGLHGKVVNYASCDTLQVKDYSKYDMGMFSEEAKKIHHEEQFPFDMKRCYDMGVELSK